MSKRTHGIVKPDFSRADQRKLDMSDMFAASVASDSEVQAARKIPIDHLLDNPYQPRLQMREESLDELAQIIELQGFQGVLVARPHPTNTGYYQLTSGHRRREAARRAGLKTLPVVVGDLSDEEMVTLTITENIQRDDLSPLEEGRVFILMAEEMSYTHEQIAREVGKKRGYVENRIRVARAPEDVQQMVQARPDTLVAAYYLAKIEDVRERAGIIEQVLAGKLTGEDIPHYIAVQSSIGRQSTATRQIGVDVDAPPEGMSTRVEQRESKQTATQESSTTSGLKDEGKAILDGDPIGREESALSAKANISSTDTALAEQVGQRAKEDTGDIDAGHGAGKSRESDLTAIKIRLAKLAAALSNLNSFKNQVAGVESISEQEIASLAGILASAGELYERFDASKPKR